MRSRLYLDFRARFFVFSQRAQGPNCPRGGFQIRRVLCYILQGPAYFLPLDRAIRNRSLRLGFSITDA